MKSDTELLDALAAMADLPVEPGLYRFVQVSHTHGGIGVWDEWTVQHDGRAYSGRTLRAALEAAARSLSPTIQPLNGTRTHPLTAHALAELRDIADQPVPRQEVNPGVANRLEREALVEVVQLPSPFPSHRGRYIAHLRITEAGLAVLRQ